MGRFWWRDCSGWHELFELDAGHSSRLLAKGGLKKGDMHAAGLQLCDEALCNVCCAPLIGVEHAGMLAGEVLYVGVC